MNSNDGFRHHPSIILEQLSGALFTLAILFAVIYGTTSYAKYIFLLMVAAVVISYVWWKRTLIYFKDDELVIERNLVSKMKKTIPYSKIASINIERKVLNRIFGTSTIKININSGVNALDAEATLVFSEDLAVKIKSELSSKVFNNIDCIEDDVVKPLINFTFKDILIHSIFGMPTGQSILALIFLMWTIISIFLQGSGITIPLVLFILVEIFPSLGGVIKFYNFKMYRTGDTIHVQHGMLQTYKSSFKISRINAVCIKQPLLARLLHKSLIELEVVGLSDSDGKKPTICLLANNNLIPVVMSEVLPEFIYDHSSLKQPAAARYPILFEYSIAVIISVLIISIIGYASMSYFDDSAISSYVVYVFLIMAVLTVFSLFICAYYSYSIMEFDMGNDLFTFVNGVLDREMSIVSYDRVQIIEIRASHIARHFDLAKCKISLLSSVGERNISSGYFYEADLSKISDRILERLCDGEYDYKFSGA